jgi:hypothetical protein
MLRDQYSLKLFYYFIYSTLVVMTISCRQYEEDECPGAREAYYGKYDNQYIKYISAYATGDVLYCKYYVNNKLTDTQLDTCLGPTDHLNIVIDGNYPCSYQKRYTTTQKLSFSGDTNLAIILTPGGVVFYCKGYTFFAYPNYIDNINYNTFQDSLTVGGVTYYNVNVLYETSKKAYLVYSTQYGFLRLVKDDEYWTYTK